MPQRHMWLHRLLLFLDFSDKDRTHHQQQRQPSVPVITGSSLQPPPAALNAGLVQPKASSRPVQSETVAAAELLEAGLDAGMKCGRLYVGLSVRRQLDSNAQLTTLAVRVMRADGLPPRAFSGTCDPYVKVRLLPDGKAVYQTKLQRRTLAPVYEESFEMNVGQMTSEHQLHFGVYDFDRYSRHDLIGAAVLQPHSPGDATERRYVLDLCTQQQSAAELGELLLSLRYLPTAGRLTVTVLKARHLRATDVTGKTDAFVKVTMSCRDQKVCKKKTSIKYGTTSPMFNEAMTFDVPQHIVEEVTLIVNVLHSSSSGGGDLIGLCAVGRQYGGPSRDHWFAMLDRPRKAVAQWYPLSDHVPVNPAIATRISGFNGNDASAGITLLQSSPPDSG